MNDKSKKTSVKHEAIMELRAITAHLDNVLAGLKAGAVNLKRGSETVTLKPEDRAAQVSIEAKKSPDKESLSIKIKWRKATATPTEEAEPLQISEMEPRPKPVSGTTAKKASIKKKKAAKSKAATKKKPAKKKAVKKAAAKI